MRDNTDQPIFLARISSFDGPSDEHGCPTMARVIPITTPDVVTLPFYINWTVRGVSGDLKVDSMVVCARFDDGRGIVLARLDGEWTSHLPGTLYVDDGDVMVQGNVAVSGDVGAGGITLKGHVHPETQSVTLKPEGDGSVTYTHPSHTLPFPSADGDR